MYTLYYSPGTASMVVHLALLEIGAPHELRLVDFDANAQHDPDYLKLNPRGVVPTLVIDGRPLSESAALLMVLAERHPEAKLAPAPGTPEHEAWQQWIVYLSNTLMSTYRFWFYPSELGAAEHTPEVRAALQCKIEGVWGAAGCATRRARAVPARCRILRCRPVADHADALVAQHAASSHRVARTEAAGRPGARKAKLEEAVRD